MPNHESRHKPCPQKRAYCQSCLSFDYFGHYCLFDCAATGRYWFFSLAIQDRAFFPFGNNQMVLGLYVRSSAMDGRLSPRFIRFNHHLGIFQSRSNRKASGCVGVCFACISFLVAQTRNLDYDYFLILPVHFLGNVAFLDCQWPSRSETLSARQSGNGTFPALVGKNHYSSGNLRYSVKEIAQPCLVNLHRPDKPVLPKLFSLHITEAA